MIASPIESRVGEPIRTVSWFNRPLRIGSEVLKEVPSSRLQGKDHVYQQFKRCDESRYKIHIDTVDG